jgi:signal peptidase I
MASPEMETTENGIIVPEAPDASPLASSAAHPAPAPHRTGSLADYVESLLVTVLIALFGTTFVVQAFKIPSQSMEPTLLVGDHLLVNKFIFGGRGAWYEKLLPYRPIRHGDIIVFKFPYDDHPHYVKRVIGQPGERIRIVDRRVYVNGKLLTEPYVVHDPSAGDPSGDNFPPTDPYAFQAAMRPEWADTFAKYVQNGEMVVPANHYFVMGDNRDHSWDSRYWGFVDRDAVMGRPMVIYWSVQATSDDYANRGLSGTFRGIGEALLHLPTRTRWHRMLREVH